MIPDRLESNKIHNLPVQINYTLPTSTLTSNETFITLLPSTHQVYVHRAGDPGEEECWGSIYLKTVISGVLHSSPELHPSNPRTPDLSLYILDPRETYLRKDRFPQPRTSSHALTSSPNISSPALGGASNEIWSGKGLVSWALDEPGLGKTLIIGRLVRNWLFGSMGGDDGTGLEGLMRSGRGGEGWGIEISMGLRSGGVGMGNGPTSLAVQAGMDLRRAVKSSPVLPSSNLSSSSRGFVHSKYNNNITRGPSTAPRPLSPARIVSTTQNTKARQSQYELSTTTTTSSQNAISSSSKIPLAPPRKSKNKPSPPTHSHSYPQPDRPRISSNSNRRVSNNDLSSVTSILSADPASLTQEEGHRLLNHPVVVRALQGLPSKGRKRKAGAGAGDVGVGGENGAKRVKIEEGVEDLESIEESRRCWTCGRTNSAVWRMKDLPDGRAATLCNACGRKDLTTAPRIDSGFKRSLSTVVERDAQRIAALRTATPVPTLSRLKDATRPGTMTSPVRGGASTTRSVRRWDGGRSSPGPAPLPPRYTTQPAPEPPAPRTPPSSSISTRSSKRRQAGVEESPNTAIRKILAYTSNNPNANPNPYSDHTMPSLDLPLSDDEKPHVDQLDSFMDIDLSLDISHSQSQITEPSNYEWSDLSAFFDIDGGYGPSPTTSTSQGHVHTDQTIPLPTSELSDQGTSTSDDVLSQLFTRAGSSLKGVGSSPGGNGLEGGGFDFSQLPPSSPRFGDLELDGFDWASMSHVGFEGGLGFGSGFGTGFGEEGQGEGDGEGKGSCSELLMSSPEEEIGRGAMGMGFGIGVGIGVGVGLSPRKGGAGTRKGKGKGGYRQDEVEVEERREIKVEEVIDDGEMDFSFFEEMLADS